MRPNPFSNFAIWDMYSWHGFEVVVVSTPFGAFKVSSFGRFAIRSFSIYGTSFYAFKAWIPSMSSEPSISM